MKVQTTGEFADISIRVPAAQAGRVCAVLENLLALLPGQKPGTGSDEDRLYTVEEVFPETHPGNILRGARHREGLTQAQLAARIGAKPSHISEMEKGRRPIGKDMSRRLAQALNTSYRVFL
ncbi:MAG: helix-turn-helix transcriptional regulator [Deltaproteobacteria bacterium]|nr:helix-turn-helix transcriptional regulator [Deltaproteobacteria bacterium]